MEIIISTSVFLIITLSVYAKVGFINILDSYRLWLQDGYWVNYNIVEAGAWADLAKGDLAVTCNYPIDLGPTYLGF